jgi:hypothetical protein
MLGTGTVRGPQGTHGLADEMTNMRGG